MKHYITSILSLVCTLFYFTPWIISPQESILFYLIAVWWFLFAWVMIIGKSIRAVRFWKRKDEQWKAMVYSALIILSTYIMVGIGITNNYIVTV